MICPHCGVNFHPEEKSGGLPLPGFVQELKRWNFKTTACPTCQNVIIELGSQIWVEHPDRHFWEEELKHFRAYPLGTNRPPTPPTVPEIIKEDYEEACRVLPISTKASAALSRRCLQAILREQGYKHRDLAKQIDAVLNEADPKKSLPTALRGTIDAIRNFGNFSAHPLDDVTTLQIIEVAPGEAEWCIEILENMFDHYYVKPEQAKQRLAVLNKKLADAKKPPAK